MLCILTYAYSPVPLAIGHPCIGCCTVGQLRVRASGRWTLYMYIRAPGGRTSVHLGVAHPCTWPLGRGHHICSLDIRAPGCCVSVHLAAGPSDVCTLGYWSSLYLVAGPPCPWPLGIRALGRCAVGRLFVWLLVIRASVHWTSVPQLQTLIAA